MNQLADLALNHHISPNNPANRFITGKFLLVIGILLVSILFHLYDINSPPYQYLPDAEYQSFIATLNYSEKFYSTTAATIEPSATEVDALEAATLEPATIAKPFIFFQLSKFLPWNLLLKGNAYLLDKIGTESFWLPRVESVIAWHVAGLFLFLACLRFFSYRSSLFSLFVFCFSPGAFVMSRCYMPEPIMMMLLCAAFFFLLNWFQNLKWHNYFAGLILSFLAILFLPKCFFILLGIYAGFGIGFLGFKDLLKDWKTYLFGAVCISAMLIYRIFGWAQSSHEHAILVWDLLIQPSFWLHWLKCLFFMMGSISHSFFSGMGAIINDYAWLLFVCISSLSLFTIADKKLKMGMLGMLGGYLLYGIFFTYHIHTHAYYHIQFFIILIFLIAAGFDFISQHFKKVNILLPILLFSSVSVSWYFSAANPLQLTDMKASSVQDARIAQQIGDRFKGYYIACFPIQGMTYQAYKNGLKIMQWPNEASYLGEKLQKIAKDGSYDDYVARIFSKAQKNGVQYFVINDVKRFEKETKLKEVLTKYKVVESSRDFVVFNIRKKAL